MPCNRCADARHERDRAARAPSRHRRLAAGRCPDVRSRRHDARAGVCAWRACLADQAGRRRSAARSDRVGDRSRRRSMTALVSPAAPAPDDPGFAELASESVILFDMTGRVRYWNPAAEILFGWPPLAMVGRTLAHLSPPADAGGGWRQLLQEGRWQGIVQRRSDRTSVV